MFQIAIDTAPRGTFCPETQDGRSERSERRSEIQHQITNGHQITEICAGLGKQYTRTQHEQGECRVQTKNNLNISEPIARSLRVHDEYPDPP